MRNISTFILALVLLMSSCKFQQKKGNEAAEGSDEKQTFQLVEQWRTDTLLKVPESVLYDGEAEVLYVSCIANRDNPEGAGYISKVDLDGKIIDLKFVTGLTFPKGMAKVGDKLYVTELNTIVEINMVSSEITGRIKVDSAVFLNDLSADAEGNLYASDSRGSAIYKISDGVASMILSDANPSPNGVLVEDDRLLVTSQEKQVLHAMDYNSRALTVLADSISRGDGIAFTGIPGHYLVSSWTGQVFMVYPDKTKASLLYTADKEIQTADIAFAIDLEMLYVPTFFGNNVVAYKLLSE